MFAVVLIWLGRELLHRMLDEASEP